jgi:hypothetical protein
MFMIDRLADYWSSKKPKRSKFWGWLNLLLTIAMIAYLVYAFTQGGLRLNQIDWKAYKGTILVVLSIYLLSLIIQFYVWARIISFHHKVSWQDVEIYSRMILMRSLPGGAWHWIGRISMYSGGTEVPTRVVVLGNFLEWALLTLSGAEIFFFSLSLPGGLGIILAILTLCVALALAVAWQPATQKRSVRLVEGSLWMVLYSMSWFLGATILYLITQAIAGAGQLNSWESFKAWTLTGSLGMLITMLPSSLGVREISLVWQLQDRLTPSVALLVALMLRIIYTLADAIWGMIGWLISSLIVRNYQPTI